MSEQKGKTSTSHGQSAFPNWFLGLIATPIVIGLLWYGRDFLTPLVMATFVYILTDALADRIYSVRIGRWSPPRWMAQIVCLFLSLSLLLGLGGVITSQAGAIVEAGPIYADRISELWEQAAGVLGDGIVDVIKAGIESIDVGSWISGIAVQASMALGSIFLVVLYLIFLFVESSRFTRKLSLIAADQEEAERVARVFSDATQAVKRYMWINTVTSLMSATVAIVVMTLLGFDFIAFLALVVFFAGYIPNIGAILSIALLSIMALVQFDTITPFLIIVFVYGGADQVISNIITPMQQSKTLNLSTFMVMVSLAFWSVLWGGVGTVLAVPIMVVVMIVCASVPGWHRWAILLSKDGEIMPAKAK